MGGGLPSALHVARRLEAKVRRPLDNTRNEPNELVDLSLVEGRPLGKIGELEVDAGAEGLPWRLAELRGVDVGHGAHKVVEMMNGGGDLGAGMVYSEEVVFEKFRGVHEDGSTERRQREGFRG